MKPETWAVVGGRPSDPGSPLNVPIYPSSNFLMGGERMYSREEATLGWEAFEQVIGGLEGGEAVAFASGMGACAAVLGELPDAGHLVLGDDCYQGVAGLAAAGVRDHAWKLERLNAEDGQWMERASVADMLWLESPSNPMLDVADLPAVCGAPRGERTKVVVDNTFATPLVQRPLELGADVVVHSATKFIGGHGDLLLGVAVTRDEELLDRLRTARGLAGATPGALECFLALRGLRTLPLRLRQATASAAELARRLEPLAAVERVRYPGSGAIVSFEVTDSATADAACASTRIIRHATSLGGVETTMERRSASPGQEHLPPGFIRISVGCEDVEDLWEDLSAALSSARS
jgi:cystathionine gamma-synthase